MICIWSEEKLYGRVIDLKLNCTENICWYLNWICFGGRIVDPIFDLYLSWIKKTYNIFALYLICSNVCSELIDF